jgi:hypothetical protein
MHAVRGYDCMYVSRSVRAGPRGRGCWLAPAGEALRDVLLVGEAMKAWVLALTVAPFGPGGLTGVFAGSTSPTNVYGMNGTIAYTLYAENFPGDCWGQKINAAISHAIDVGRGTAVVQLPPGDLNVSTPIRFARTRPGDACSQLHHTHNLASVWACAAGLSGTDLPRGLTLLGTGGTTGDVYEDWVQLH